MYFLKRLRQDLARAFRPESTNRPALSRRSFDRRPLVEAIEACILSAGTPTVTGFALINPATNQQTNTLSDGAVINQALLPAGEIAIRADATSAGSVKFAIDGIPVRIETTAPYSLFSNNGPDYFGGKIPLGPHTLSATPYSGPNATGDAGPTKSVQFNSISQSRPNFVFVYTDDQRWDAMGVVQREMGSAGRFPWLVGKTPNMDRLAAEGTRFRNAFVVNSLCSPGRSSMLTGQYSHLTGVTDNHTSFPVNSVTYATQMRSAGYTTGFTGKWHMGTQTGNRPGFDFTASYTGQGTYFGTPFNVNGKISTPSGWIDDVTTDYAANFINNERDNPFAVVVGFKSAHADWQPPDRLKNELLGQTIRATPVNGVRAPYLPTTRATTGRDPEQDRNYFRTLIGADQNLGRILTQLDRLNLTENTVVVYTSDNGYIFGEHGIGDKRAAYEESIRVPLIVRYPRLALKGKTVNQMVLNIDIPSTLLDLAGVNIPTTMQGRSLKPLLAGQSPAWRSSWFYEYFQERSYEPPIAPPNLLAVRTDTAKLIKYPGHPEWTELFDLRTDPYESRNLFNVASAATLKQQMLAEFDKVLAESKFRVPPNVDYPFTLDP